MEKDLKNFDERCGGILEYFGRVPQLDMVVEELSEVIKEICKFKRGKDNQFDMLMELADAHIVLEQLRQAFNITDDMLIEAINTKLDRTEQFIRNEREGKSNE